MVPVNKRKDYVKTETDIWNEQKVDEYNDKYLGIGVEDINVRDDCIMFRNPVNEEQVRQIIDKKSKGNELKLFRNQSKNQTENGYYTQIYIKDFKSWDNIRDKISQIWEVYNKGNPAQMSSAFSCIKETKLDKNKVSYEDEPATLTNAFKYGVSMMVVNGETLSKFTDNVIARLIRQKELLQKDTKTHIIGVYSILIS